MKKNGKQVNFSFRKIWWASKVSLLAIENDCVARSYRFSVPLTCTRAIIRQKVYWLVPMPVLTISQQAREETPERQSVANNRDSGAYTAEFEGCERTPREKSICVFFFSFCFLPPRLVFLQMNRKRISLTGVLFQHSNWNCDLEVTGELQRRRTGWAGSGSGHRYRDRDRQRVWTWCTRHSGSRRRSDVVQCHD